MGIGKTGGRMKELLNERVLFDASLSQKEYSEGKSPVNEVRIIEISPTEKYTKIQFILKEAYGIGWFYTSDVKRRIIEILPKEGE